MSLRQYTFNRLVQLVPTVLAVLTIVFFAVRFLPGDPVQIMLQYAGSEAAMEEMRELYGLNDPLWVQYFEFLRQYASLEFGRSIITGRPVVDMIAPRLPHTLLLAVSGTFLAVLIGVPAGIISAVHQDTWLDDTVMVGALLGVSTPSFWIGLILILLFAENLQMLPATGTGTFDNPGSLIIHLLLPAVTLGTYSASLIARVTRSSMLEVLDKEFIQAARARGIVERSVIYKHAFMNASIPVVTIVGLFLGQAIGGTIVIEQVFARPGIGRMLLNGIYSRDYPIIQGATVVVAVGFMLVNLVTDLTYAWLDPRIKY